MNVYDCVVVGAGPSGSSAAYFLARAGFKVLVLEKRRMPRAKCCAGGVPRKARHIFDFDLSPCWETEVKGAVFSWLSQNRRYLGGKQVLGWIVRREVFDHFLMKKAREAGAEVREGEEVIGLAQDRGKTVVYTRRASFTALSAVGADGARSRVARCLSLKHFKKIGFALEARLSVPEQVLKDRGAYLYFDFGGVPRGYSWLFPRKDHVCAGVASRQSGRFYLRSYLKDYLEREGLGREFRKAKVTGAAISFSVWPGGFMKGRCLLAGDAAGLTDRLTGEGIYYALRSGEFAARAIGQFLSGRDTLDLYAKLVRRHLGENLFWASILSRTLGWFPRLIFDRAISHPRRARKGMLVTTGELTYRRLIFG